MSWQLARIVLLILFALGILVLSLLPDVPVNVRFLMGLDKVQHWLAYAVLGFLVLLTINNRGGSLPVYYAICIFSCTMYGGLIEVLQGFTGRTPETADFFVNMFGAAAGGVAALGFIQISRNRQKKGEDPPENT